MKVHGDAWVGDKGGDEYWAEGEKCSVEVEATDADEIRIGVVLKNESSHAATVYLSRTEADRLARFIAAASVSPVQVPA